MGVFFTLSLAGFGNVYYRSFATGGSLNYFDGVAVDVRDGFLDQPLGIFEVVALLVDRVGGAGDWAAED